MRPLFLLPVLLATLACSSKLDKGKAEDAIRKSYPVVIPITIPEQVTAERGTPDHLRQKTLRENLEQSGGFETAVLLDGNRETCVFRLKPGASKGIKPTARGLKAGFLLPVAEGGFVRVLKVDSGTETAKVTYEIRLQNPTSHFPLFLSMHPESKVGDLKERHATFRKRGGSWELSGTDEAFHKAE